VTRSLAEGATRAGRDLEGFDLAVLVQVRIGDDLEAARDVMRPMLALYVGGMGSREHNFYNRMVRGYGFEQAAAAVQDHYLDRRADLAQAALPAELIDAVTICGPLPRVRERLDALREAGVTTLIASPMAGSPEDGIEQLRLLAKAFEEAAA